MLNSRSSYLTRRSQLIRLALATSAGLGGIALLSKPTAAQSYMWTNASGGDWSDPTTWAGGMSPVGGPGTQILFNTDGTYTSNADVVPADGQFNLSGITVSMPTASSSVTLGILGTTVDTLNFVSDNGANPPKLLVTSGSLSVQNGCIWVSGSNINNSGSGNLILGAGSPAQGAQSFGDNTIITNSGAGTIQLGDGIAYNSASGAMDLTLSNPGGGLFEIGNLGEGVVGTLNIASGPVTFAGNTAGNLFGNNLILNIESGASFNFANNGETMGGIEGAGNIIMGTAGITVTLAGNRTFTGAMSGTGTFTQDVVNGTLIFGGSNSYSGTTTVEAFGGVLAASAAYVFSPNSFVNVTGGGTLNVGGYNQSIAGLAGGNYNGSLSLGSSTLTISPVANATRIFNSPLTGTGSVIIAGAGTEELFGANTYTGTTTVTSGTLVENYVGIVNSSSVSVASGAALQLVVDTNVTGTTNYSVSGSLIKSGNGNLTISSSNPSMNPSSLTVNGGSLVLDHTTDNGTGIGTSAALSLGSGTVSLLGNPSATSSESFTSTTLVGGGQFLVAASSQNASINAGAISRAAGLGSTVNFNVSSSGAGVASVSTTTANGAYNIVGGFATYNGSDWAVTGTGNGPFNVAPLAPASYASNSFAATSAAAIVHTNVTSSFTAGTGAFTSDIRFNASSATTLTLKGSETVVDGGILVTPNVGANTSTISGSTGNTLAVPAGQDLIVNQFDTKGALALSAVVANTPGTSTTTQAAVSITSGASQTITLQSPDTVSNLNLSLGELVTVGAGTGTNLNASSNATIVAINPATNSITVASTGANMLTSSGNTLTFTPGANLVKSGPGQLKLTSANAFKGLLVLNQGTTTVTSASFLGSTSSGSSSIYFNGGTLEANVAFNGTEGINDWIIGPGGATIQVDGTDVVSKYGNTIWGSGDITLTGTGTFDIGSDGSSFTGRIFVNSGAFRLTSNQVASSTGITVANGAQYALDDTTSGPFNIAPGAALTLNGNGPIVAGAYTGAWDHYLAEAGSADYAFNSPIILASTSRFVETLRADGSAPGGFDGCTDIFPYTISGPGNLIKDGDGTLVLGNAGNTYGGGASGTSIISNGVLQLGVTNGVPAGSTIQFGEANVTNSGTFDLNGFNQTVQNLTVAMNTGGDQQIINSSNASNPSVLTVAYNGSTPQAFSGFIGGVTALGANANNIVLAISGTGNFVISSSNTYSGGTNVSSGTLTGAVATAFGTGNLLINPTGTSGTSADAATVNSTNSIGTTAAVTVNSNSPTAIGTLNLYGLSEMIGSLSGNGVVVLANASGTALTTGNATNTTFAGNISDVNGSGSLIKVGTGTFTLSGSNTYGGQTNVSAGVLVIAVAGALPKNNSVFINTGATLVVDSQNTVSSTSLLNINGNMVVHNGSLPALSAAAQTAYTHGWNGTSGIISSAAANDPAHLTALGVILNDNGGGIPLYGSGGTIAATFEGIAPVDSDVLLKYTYYGDTNLDGKVDGTDYSRIDSSFIAEQTSPTPLSISGWFNGDFNYDGVVDGSDYTLIDNAFNTQGAQIASAIAAPTAQIGGASSAVPESTMLGAIGLGALGLLGRRRRVCRRA